MNRIVRCAALGAAVVLAAGCRRAPRPAQSADTSTAHAAMPGMVMADSGAPMLAVSPAERARLGIVMVTATVGPLTQDLRLVGRVVPAETAARTVTTKVDGFVERLYVDFTGREVQAGEPLFELYSPSVVAGEQDLMLALRLRASLGTSPAPDARANADSLVAASRRRLRYWDLDSAQVAAIEQTGAVQRTVTFRAPVTGTVMEKNVVQGQAIAAGAPLFQIANLTTVWLEADVFESDLGVVRTGEHAQAEFDAWPGQPVHGMVTYVYPTVDPVARTGKVRIELPNPDNRIRPGMFGTVHVTAPIAARAIVIPRQAALVTGDRQLVFVEDTMGMLVPRLVTLGAQTDSLVEVRSGVAPGERVAATAAFLLDAEQNLGAAMQGMAGMDMGPGTARKPAAPAPRPVPAAAPAKHDTMPDMPGMQHYH